MSEGSRLLITHHPSLITGVLFDFYDTLAYLDPPIIEAGRRELARLASLAFDDLAPHWRASARARMLGTAGDMATQLRAILRAAGQEPPDELIEELAALEFRTWGRAVTLYPDSEPVLRELRRRGFKLGILSNCSCQAGAVIRSLGLSDLVDALVLSCEVGLAKPDAAIYAHACADLDLPPPSCAFVADGAGGELEGARAVGLPTVKVRRPNARGPEDPTVLADHRVESLEEALALILHPSSHAHPGRPG